MGLYIVTDSKGEKLPLRGKADAILADGALEVNGIEFMEHLVCVVEQPMYDAVAFIYDRTEMDRFRTTLRPTRWFQWPVGTKAFEEKYPEILGDNSTRRGAALGDAMEAFRKQFPDAQIIRLD